MTREIRTLWWCAQGLLIFLGCGFFGHWTIGAILLIPHGIGAVHSHFVMEEE